MNRPWEEWALRWLPWLLPAVWLAADVALIATLVFSHNTAGAGFVMGFAVGHLLAVIGWMFLSARVELGLLFIVVLVPGYVGYVVLVLAAPEAACVVAGLSVLLLVASAPLLIVRQYGWRVKRIAPSAQRTGVSLKVSLRELFGVTTVAATCTGLARWFSQMSVGARDLELEFLLYLFTFILLTWLAWSAAFRLPPLSATLVPAAIGMVWGVLIAFERGLSENSIVSIGWCVAQPLAIALHVNLLRLAGYDLVNEFEEKVGRAPPA